MKTLIFWSLESSEAIKNIIKESYKQQRHEDDLNQPLSVQAWGKDGDKRRFWLIEGRDDTHFRLYRESNPALKHVTWRSVAGSIEEVRAIADKLGEDSSQASRRLRERIMNAIPRFEESEEVCYGSPALKLYKTHSLTLNRNAENVIIASLDEPNSPVQNPASPSMKVAHVGNESDIPTPMRKGPQTQLENRTVSPGCRHQRK